MRVRSVATRPQITCDFYAGHMPQLPVCSYASVVRVFFGAAIITSLHILGNIFHTCIDLLTYTHHYHVPAGIYVFISEFPIFFQVMEEL